MAKSEERRGAPRVVAARSGRFYGRANLDAEVRLLDVSRSGVRIAHLALLRPGFPAVLEFPPALGRLSLAAHVVRSCIIATQLSASGERQLCYQSALAFVDPTAEQQAILAGILGQLRLACKESPCQHEPLEGPLSLSGDVEVLGLAGSVDPSAPANQLYSRGARSFNPSGTVEERSGSGRLR